MKFLKKRNFIIASALFLFLSAAVFGYGFTPILKVESEYVTYAKFLKIYGAFKTYDQISQKNITDDKELKRRALASLVEDRFIDLLIQKTNANLKLEAQNNVEKAILDMKDFSLDEAASKLYGLSAADFKKFVLIPEAEKDLLIKHYEYNPSDLDGLWDQLGEVAEVKIYYPGYYWEKGEVKRR